MTQDRRLRGICKGLIIVLTIEPKLGKKDMRRVMDNERTIELTDWSAQWPQKMLEWVPLSK